MDKLKEYVRKADEIFELHKKVLAKSGFALSPIYYNDLADCNYECIKR